MDMLAFRMIRYGVCSRVLHLMKTKRFSSLRFTSLLHVYYPSSSKSKANFGSKMEDREVHVVVD
jgi:hypothetical protein